jgi:N-acetylmuramoyl-L-alanine amidase
MRLHALVASAVVVASTSGLVVLDHSSSDAALSSGESAQLVERTAALPLAGVRVVLDPGHQLGNARFPAQISKPVPAGDFTKPCNTTGTATDAGYPEATFTWGVAQQLEADLEAQGAKVVLTRTSNSADKWGPCVDARGRMGNPRNGHRGADLKISIHGDGSTAAGAHGFHVIRAPGSPGARRLALDTRTALDAAGLDRATYTAGGDGLDVRSDLGTLNLSEVPTVMVELGNMRDGDDAARMTSASGQATYAAALAAAARAFLRR